MSGSTSGHFPKGGSADDEYGLQEGPDVKEKFKKHQSNGSQLNANIAAGGSGADMQEFVSTRMELLKRAQSTLKRTALLAAFVPDFILTDEGHRIPYQTTLDAVVVIADVSGFTALTEKYSLKGKGGTDQLTKTLSSYMGPLAECILRAGGDIIKYAGDAILAVWKVLDKAKYYVELQRVVDCTLYIQEKYGSYETDVGITIRVKLGIGAGRIFQCGIGNQEYHHFVCFGPGVKSASEAEHHCESGEVIMQEAAWEFCNPQHFNFAVKEPGFMRIFEINTFVDPEVRGRPMETKDRMRTNKPSKDISVIRATVNMAVEKKMEDKLRRYVIPPVLKKMDDDMPLEYLNESRQTCICFIKLEILPFEPGTSFVDAMLYIVQTAFKYIYKTGVLMGGCLTKIIMFDKGLTYLVVFGLPGYLHDNQAANALKFSYRVKDLLDSIKHVSEVSLGVTSGATYCGVLGHERREEYTVIGRKVNKAARLMCYYPGKVTCDQDTLYHSKLPVHHFSLMEAKELKGIKNVGNIYEYLSSDSSEDQSVKLFDYPMLGRETEFRYFNAILDSAESEFSRFIQAHRMQDVVYDLRTTKEVTAAGLWMLNIEADIGMGKSRLLAACIQEAERRGIKVFSITMNMMLGSQGLACVRALLFQAFGMEDMRSPQEREEHLRRVVGDDADLGAGLCLLNSLLGLKFPMHPRYVNAEMSSRHALSMHILNVLVRHIFPEHFVIFVIDDAHQMESTCWEYLLHMSRTPAALTLLSIRRNNAGIPKLPETVSKILFHNKNVKSIRLSGLENNFCLPVACQVIEVAGIPVELEKILVTKSQGNPAWIEQVLIEMLRTGLIKILNFDLREATRRNMRLSLVDKKCITRLEYRKRLRNKAYNWHSDEARETSSGDNLHGDGEFPFMSMQGANASVRVQKELIRPETRMCVVKSDTNIGSAPIPGTLKEMLLDAFDELNSNEQLLLKSASVLGFRFCRAMLISLVPLYENNARKYQQGIRRLMELKHIKCASLPHPSAKDKAEVDCFCRFTQEDDTEVDTSKVGDGEAVLEDESKHPKYYRCKFMQFCKDNLLDVVYELMTEDQRKELHLKAARYLSASIILCRVCGGEDTAYTFGFTLKGADIGGDHEEALRSAGAAGKRRIPAMPMRRQSIVRRNTANSLDSDPGNSSGGIKTGSTRNKIDNIKKIYENSGKKIAGIAVEIMETVDKFERLQMQRALRIPLLTCCDGKQKKRRQDRVEEAREFQLTITMLDKMNEDGEGGGGAGDETEPGRGTGRVQRYDSRAVSISSARPALVGAMGGRRDVVDFRGCGCNNIQAKIALDLVRHYRIAEKYGKCLMNLLAASETSIAVGNSTQSLVHIEDAQALMQALESLELVPPKADDPDDAVVDSKEVNIMVEFLTGLSFFELGVQVKAEEFFARSLKHYGIEVPADDDKVKRNAAIVKAASKLWQRHNCVCCAPRGKSKTKKKLSKSERADADAMSMKLRIFSYLHTLYKAERKMEMALLVSLWQLITAQDASGSYEDVLPAYCNMMDMYTSMSEHKKASTYEKYALALIRANFGSEEAHSALGIYTSANVFLTISAMRTLHGDLQIGIDASYLALRIATAMHDNALVTQVLPRLISALLFTLRISEVIECLQRLWYTTEEEDDWSGFAIYYTLCLELLLNTAYPMEPFFTCENFVLTTDWDADTQMFRTYEVQYHIEASLALWHCRFSRWETAQSWKEQAELHKPKVTSYLSVGGELKLLECELILVKHYLETKRYQHFAKARNNAKTYMRGLQKTVLAAPVFQPRFWHLMGYYCRIRFRKSDCEKYLRKAEAIASTQGNELEKEWISHNRNVWMDTAIPSIRLFWLEHTEYHTLDWHQSGSVPWANIMYSLPIPEWGTTT